MAAKKKSFGAGAIPLAQARAFWFRKQFPPAKTIRDAISATGWVRTLGGADVYLSVLARFPSLTREQLDEGVATGAFQVVPSVRGCIYLVPSADVPLALRISSLLSRTRTERELEKVNVAWKEVESLAKSVLGVIAKSPSTTDEVRKALPAGAVRSLGEAGKKIGLSSPLPVALRHLEHEGKIRRIPVDSRLDTERYVWHAVKGGLSGDQRDDDTALLARLLGQFLRHHGPASLAQMCTWSGFAQRDVKAALANVATETVPIEDHADEAFVLAGELEPLRDTPPAGKPGFTLLSFEDNLTVVHGGPGVWADEKHHGLMTPEWGSAKKMKLGEAKHLSLRPVFHGEKLAGFWEMLPARKSVVTHLFDAPGKAEAKLLSAAVERVEMLLNDGLGHAHSFQLDTDEAVTARAQYIQKLAR